MSKMKTSELTQAGDPIGRAKILDERNRTAL